MPKYMVLFRANPEKWPTDPKQQLALWEWEFAGIDQAIKSGIKAEIGWFTNTYGYAIIESESKEKVLALVLPFFPYYSQEIHEIVSTEAAKETFLSSARTAASQSGK